MLRTSPVLGKRSRQRSRGRGGCGGIAAECRQTREHIGRTSWEGTWQRYTVRASGWLLPWAPYQVKTPQSEEPLQHPVFRPPVPTRRTKGATREVVTYPVRAMAQSNGPADPRRWPTSNPGTASAASGTSPRAASGPSASRSRLPGNGTGAGVGQGRGHTSVDSQVVLSLAAHDAQLLYAAPGHLVCIFSGY
jgi:hypothetical protein